MAAHTWTFDFWVIFGLLGQLIFGSRFIIQWIASERKKASYIPLLFWYFSLLGGVITTIYAIHKKDTVFTIGQGAGLIVYVRNLMLIHRNADETPTTTAPPDRA